MKRLIAAVSLIAVSGPIASPPATTRASYDIELEYTGFMSLSPCTVPLNPNGYDRMVGTVTGNETSGIEEDIEYKGTLSRTTDIDICDLTGPTADKKVDCKATLTGSALMGVSLMVHGYADGGAWLKAKVISTTSVNVSGNCDEGADNRTAYLGTATGGAGGASPDGQLIEDRFSQPSRLVPSAAGPGPRFYVGGLARLRVGYYPPDPAAGGWSLWVKRKVP